MEAPDHGDGPDGNLWQELLSRARGGEQISDGTLLVLGVDGSGRRTLTASLLRAARIAALRRQNRPPPPPEELQQLLLDRAVSLAELGYTFLEPALEDDSANPKVNVWVAGSQPGADSEPLARMMKVAVSSATALERTVALVLVDLSRPWDAVETVSFWAAELERLVEQVAQDHPEAVNQLRNNIERYLKQVGATHGDLSRFSTQRDGPGAPATDAELEALAAPLPRGMLEQNIGIPIIVVGTKSDVVTRAADDVETELRLEFIQKHLRRFCLRVGASLLYTSARGGINIDVLFEQAMHLLYPQHSRVPFVDALSPEREATATAICTARDAVFVPAGFDRAELIDLLASTSSQRIISWSSDSPFDQVIIPPSGAARHTGTDSDGGSDNEESSEALAVQPFFQKLLEKQGGLSESGRAQTVDAASAALKAFNATASSITPGISESSTTPPQKPRATANVSKPLASREPVPAAPESRRTITAQDAKENPELIANFFQDLLSKTDPDK